jgi:hypothetical protein
MKDFSEGGLNETHGTYCRHHFRPEQPGGIRQMAHEPALHQDSSASGPAAAIPKSPTYPKRNHTTEGPKWQDVLATWDAKIEPLVKAIPAGTSLGEMGEKGRVLAQMIGSRDQIRDAARRLPQQVTHLYHEDQERLEFAVAALERLFQKYKSL